MRRVRQKRSPFSGDRTHIHHVLEWHSFSPKQMLVVLILVQSVLNMIGVLLYVSHAPGYLVFWSFVLLMAGYFYRLRHFSEAGLSGGVKDIAS